ncbi:MAG: hypothetical protein ACE5JR_07735 [Gemmatimonadota bacterium]
MRRVVASLAVAYLLVLLFDSGQLQLQYLLFGKVVAPSAYIKYTGFVVLVWLALLIFLYTPTIYGTPDALLWVALVYCLFILTGVGLHLFSDSRHLSALLYAETFHHFFILVTFLALVAYYDIVDGERTIPSHAMYRALYLTAPPIFLLGYVQALANHPIIPVEIPDALTVQSYVLLAGERVRAFSIFGSSFEYGHYISLIGALSLAYLLVSRERRHAGLFLMLYVASALAALSTFTRNTYLEFALTSAGVGLIPVALRKGVANRRIIFTSVATGLIVFGTVVGYFLASARSGAEGLLSLRSFGLRLAGQLFVLRTYFLDAPDVQSLLLGRGIMQGDRFAELKNTEALIFDNTFLDIALYSGLVGLLLFCSFFVGLFSFALNRVRRTGEYWWVALAGIFGAYPAVAMINIHVGGFFLAVALILSYHVRRSMTEADTSRRTAAVGA